MFEEYAIFEKFLKEKKLKLTNQRRAILKCFLNVERHLSVENLYDIIKKKNLGLGQTTVFRTLKLLCEANIAREVDFGDKTIRYEHAYRHQHHDHLICVECGIFIEAMDPEIEKLQDKLCKKFDFIPRKHRMEIFGVCEKCRNKKQK